MDDRGFLLNLLELAKKYHQSLTIPGTLSDDIFVELCRNTCIYRDAIRAEALKEASAEIEKLKGQRDRAVEALKRITPDDDIGMGASAFYIHANNVIEARAAIAEIEGGE